MAKAAYTAYVTRKGGSHVRDFGSGKNAVAWVKQAVNEGDAGFVTRVTKDRRTVIFNSHDGHGSMRRIDFP